MDREILELRIIIVQLRETRDEAIKQEEKLWELRRVAREEDLEMIDKMLEETMEIKHEAFSNMVKAKLQIRKLK